jgi:predicted heme/steroid binding protein
VGSSQLFINIHSNSKPEVLSLVELRKFTIEDLKKYDGKNGRPAYIAFNGKVYDVTNSVLWGDGEHFSLHKAGEDTSDGISNAPHGDEKLEAIILIGELEK